MGSCAGACFKLGMLVPYAVLNWGWEACLRSQWVMCDALPASGGRTPPRGCPPYRYAVHGGVHADRTQPLPDSRTRGVSVPTGYWVNLAYGASSSVPARRGTASFDVDCARMPPHAFARADPAHRRAGRPRRRRSGRLCPRGPVQLRHSRGARSGHQRLPRHHHLQKVRTRDRIQPFNHMLSLACPWRHVPLRCTDSSLLWWDALPIERIVTTRLKCA